MFDQQIALIKVDDALAESLKILATLKPMEIVLLACVWTREWIDFHSKFSGFVPGAWEASILLDKRNNLVKIIQKRDLERLKVIFPAASSIYRIHDS